MLGHTERRGLACRGFNKLEQAVHEERIAARRRPKTPPRREVGLRDVPPTHKHTARPLVSRNRAEIETSRQRLQVAAERLLALDRLEERLEVPLAESGGTVTLDHLEEERRPVLRSLREDLEQVAVVVAVGEDA